MHSLPTEPVIRASTSSGILVAFERDHVLDWSVNRVAADDEDDPALEVVFDRAEGDGRTQRLFFNGGEAERVVAFLILGMSLAGEKTPEGSVMLSSTNLKWRELNFYPVWKG